VFDFEPVCRAAKKIIRREGLGRRMKTHVGDMFKKIPTGHDVVMFWDIGPLEQKTLALTYQSLPTRGMLVVGGIYRSAHRKRSLKSLTRQFITHMPRPTQTRQQLIELIKSVGFNSVKHRIAFDQQSLVTGRK